MSVAIGDTVLYTLDEADCVTIGALRNGAQRHTQHNPVVAEQTFPAMVVAIAPNGALNLKVALDGDDWYWKQFAMKANDPTPGCWVEQNGWKPL